VGDGLDIGVAVGVGVDATVGLTLGATVDPQAARLKAAIAEPKVVVSFMPALAHSTRTVINSYICANASTVYVDVTLTRRDEARVDLRPEPWTSPYYAHDARDREGDIARREVRDACRVSLFVSRLNVRP
jgi:hypothetical protein